MYTIKIKRSALKATSELPRNIKKQIEEIIDTLKSKPIPARTTDLKKLKGAKNTYRIRIGNVRLVYTIDATTKTIMIHYVGPRGDAY